ncbi:MAG: hypothetical protein CL607_16920 [Anaerolineaceae bacterium]|nr:hypothetical protein [Anaerolineaceae bacterium]|tara:strand:+ start:27 stop:422 length:396 start_codon:yes stop_codon:yes gene_type:complete
MSLRLDEMKEIARRFVIEPWEHGHVDVLDEVCAPNYKVGHDGDIQQLKDAILKTRVSFKNLKVTIHDMAAEGDLVAYRWTMTGIFEKAFNGVAPTGEEASNTGITILRFENGKIVEDQYESSSDGVETPST